MKKKALIIVAFAAVMCLAVAMLTGCSSNSSSSSSTKAAGSSSAATTTLKVGFDQDFPPYGYVADNGSFTGLDLDLAAEVAKRNGWDIKYVPINWDAKDSELSSGSIDCIWNGFTIEGREDGYTWTEPYMDNSQVVVTKESSGINSLADLAGKTVMAQADSAALHLLEADGDQAALAATFKNLQTTPEYNTAFMELESGAVDAVAIDMPVAKFQLQGKTGYKILSEQLSSEHYGVGFLKGNTDLRDKVQKTLKEMVADGTAKTICEKYADQGISYDQWILAA